MPKNRKRPKKFLNNVRGPIFVRFVLIFLLLILIILSSSASLYTSMIESANSIQMRIATEELQAIELYADDALEQIYEIERHYGFIVEIYALREELYGKINTDKPDISTAMNPEKIVYTKYNYSLLHDDFEDLSFENNFEPIIKYSETEYSNFRKYDKFNFSTIVENKKSGQKHLVFVTYDQEREFLYVTAMKYVLIDSQAKTISFSATVITAIIFFCVTIAVYLYITFVTKPLNDIIQITKIMSEGKDKSIRIPIRKNSLKTGTDDAINTINALYESLMLTQESLLEKSKILANQLEEKEAEQKSRAKFIADTSHELKTPISIIQGYAEGVKYVLDDREATLEYCDTIIEECKNMTSLVVNMMSLSNIQHSDNLNITKFSITEFIEERMKLHQKIFDKNEIGAINNIKSIIYGYGDVEKLQYVINNLLSNAVSYASGYKKFIVVEYEDAGTSYRISVYNTGNQISPEKLKNLWDSFYRADQARLRSDGHFGLGLSIVKAVQDAHSQRCGVENAEGGVKFWFDIAKKKNNSTT